MLGRRAPAAVLSLALFAAGWAGVVAQETVLRGRFRVELEPVAAYKAGDPYPVPDDTARVYALEEAARVFSGMIYGWSFDYEIGDRARGVAEAFSLSPLGSIPYGDPRLSPTEVELEGSLFFLWAEYRMGELQIRSYAVLREGEAKGAQGTGSAPISAGKDGHAAALDDAARLAVRSLLVFSERSKPKEARGTVVLTEVPRIWVEQGRFQCAARFRVVVKEVVPYRYF